jgi:hypothetical protein
MKIEIALPQLVPSQPILGPQLGYDDLAHRTSFASIVTGALTCQILGQRNRFIGGTLSGCTTFGGQEWSTKMSNGAPRNYGRPPRSYGSLRGRRSSAARVAN